MTLSADDVTTTVLHESCHVLDDCLTKIKHCLDQFSDQQVWWRPDPQMNSIGNLLLHLTGNVRQWIVAGIGGDADTRDRPAEFAARDAIPKDVVLGRLVEVISEAKSVLARPSAEDMLAKRRIQGFDLTGWQAIFDCVPHFKGHTQEIISLTRLQLGDAYQFLWQPQTREEGA